MQKIAKIVDYVNHCALAKNSFPVPNFGLFRKTIQSYYITTAQVLQNCYFLLRYYL